MALVSKTIRVEESLWASVAEIAWDEGVTMTHVIVDNLGRIAKRGHLGSMHTAKRKPPNLRLDPATCEHPSKLQRRLKMGVFCSCGTRMS